MNLSPGEYSRLRELCPEGMSESAFFREMLRQAGPVEAVPTRAAALRLLGASARSGKVAAQVALVRELRSGTEEAALDWVWNGDG